VVQGQRAVQAISGARRRHIAALTAIEAELGKKKGARLHLLGACGGGATGHDQSEAGQTHSNDQADFARDNKVCHVRFLRPDAVSPLWLLRQRLSWDPALHLLPVGGSELVDQILQEVARHDLEPAKGVLRNAKFRGRVVGIKGLDRIVSRHYEQAEIDRDTEGKRNYAGENHVTHSHSLRWPAVRYLCGAGHSLTNGAGMSSANPVAARM
jgi:hypothetical protein